MFQKTLKKKLRLKHLKKILGPIGPDEKCLLVTCGDNNGAINYYLRQLGGGWSFADLEPAGIAEMSELLGSRVALATESRLPYPDGEFDRVVAIDTHEHVSRPDLFTAELSRIMRPDSQAIVTVPGGQSTRAVNRIKEWVGMTRDKYGHVTEGFSSAQIGSFMRSAGLRPERSTTFSRFFTELIELTINFVYVNVLSKGSKGREEVTNIAPQTLDQLTSVRKTYAIYSVVYPFVWLFSQLDRFLLFSDGYVVIVEGRKDRTGV
jgi:SAM-dependent methyltransferase